MRLDRVLALVLVLACLAAAVGVWLTGAPRGEVVTGGSVTGGTPDIAVIDVYGAIGDGGAGSPFGQDGANSVALLQALRDARQDHVKAVLLRVNSPGGTAAASQAVNEAIAKLRKETKIPVVVSVGDMAASGAYYISSAADRIVANPASMVGSIGVIIHEENISSLLSRYGVSDVTIKSGAHKDLLSPFKPVNPGDRQILQALVNDTYAQFLAAVSTGRHIPLATLRPLADGRVFTGRQALALHLVDALGNYDDALALTAKLAGVKGTPATRDYTAQPFWQEFVPHLGSELMGRLGLGTQAPGFGMARVPLALWE